MAITNIGREGLNMQIIRELETLDLLLQGHSIARFGDGELRLAAGQSVGHQQAIPQLTEELHKILSQPTKCLVGIPYVDKVSPLAHVWFNYSLNKFTRLYNPEKQYYSAFISRPDSAPWIDTPEYWQKVKGLWQGKDVIAVGGSAKGFRLEEMEKETKSVKFIKTLPEEAYSEIDAIEKEIGNDTSKVVLLAVGATATVLAYRLAEKGFQALDLGHLSMFMRRRGQL